MGVSEQALAVAEINNYPTNKFNRLFPCTMTQLSPLHKVMVNVVQIDPDSKSEVYDQKGKDEVSLTKISCLKLMTAANVIMEDSKPILPSNCKRCVEVARMTKTAPQCGSCPTKNDVAYQVSILVPEPSGGYRRYVATKEINKANYKGMPEHMAAQCETKALLRALRAGLGIKGSYTREELRKPFAVALVVLNTTDPELKSALIRRYAAGADALFGAPPTTGQLTSGEVHALPEGDGDEAGSTINVTDESLPNFSDMEEPPSFGGFQPDYISCEGNDCGGIIEGFTDVSGKEYTPESFAQWTEKNLGRKLCRECAEREVKEMQAARARDQRKGA